MPKRIRWNTKTVVHFKNYPTWDVRTAVYRWLAENVGNNTYRITGNSIKFINSDDATAFKIKFGL